MDILNNLSPANSNFYIATNVVNDMFLTLLLSSSLLHFASQTLAATEQLL